MPIVFAAGDAAMNPADPWLQYGSWGVLVFIVLLVAFKGIPKMFELHKEVVGKVAEDSKVALTKVAEDAKAATTILTSEQKAVVKELLCSFEKESEQCRAERLETARLFVAEQEKNREAKHALAKEFHETMSKFATAGMRPA